jgi:hypothetical protein
MIGGLRECLAYLLAALALGGVGYCGSEALFWSFTPEDLTPTEWLQTVAFYALAGACALSAAIWSGLGGWRGVFLAAAVAGFVVEGVIVSEIYEAFPFQLVWTPLAWHGAVTGLVLFGLHRVLSRGPLLRQIWTMAGIGALLSLWSAYWPLERDDLPGARAIFLYQAGSALAGVLGLVAFDRLTRLPRPAWPILALAPGLTALVWIAEGISDPRPERLSLPAVLGLTLWAMRRLGRGAGRPVWAPVPAGRHLPFLVAPLVVVGVSAFLVRGTAGLEVNVVAVLLLVPLGLGLWLWLLWKAARV